MELCRAGSFTFTTVNCVRALIKSEFKKIYPFIGVHFIFFQFLKKKSVYFAVIDCCREYSRSCLHVNISKNFSGARAKTRN